MPPSISARRSSTVSYAGSTTAVEIGSRVGLIVGVGVETVSESDPEEQATASSKTSANPKVKLDPIVFKKTQLIRLEERIG